MNRIEKLEELARYYCSELCEDPIDGTDFDCAILNAIEKLKEQFKFKQKNPKDQYIAIVGAIEEVLNTYEDNIWNQEKLKTQIQTYINDLKKLSKYMKENNK